MWTASLFTAGDPPDAPALFHEARAGGALDQHRVAVAEEAVPPRHRLPVRLEDPIAPPQGAREDQQGGAREVEVGEEGVDGPERVARPDEELGAPLAGDDLPAPH